MSDTILNLDDVTKAIAKFSETDKGIAELREKYEGVVFDVTDAKGMKEAKAARQEVRQPRYEIERLRKEAKKPILALGRHLDKRAAEITETVLAIETPIDDQIKIEENRIEAERQAKIDAEIDRVESIQARIEGGRAGVDAVINSPRGSGEVADYIALVRGQEPGKDFEEFQQQAREAWLAGIARLESHHASLIEREAEDARIAAERKELEELRAANEKREAEERAKRKAAEAEERKKREAEEAKQRAELEAQRKKQEEDQKRIDAENKRIADEKAELERKQKEDADRKAAEEKAEADRKAKAVEAAKKAEFPGKASIINALCEYFSVPKDVVSGWLKKL